MARGARRGGAPRSGERGTGEAVASERRPARRGWNRASLLFLGLAVVLAAIAIYLALAGDEPEVPPPPPAPVGENELIHVQLALEAEGLDVESGRQGVPAGALEVPGQRLTVEGTPLYVFRYPNPDAAEAAAATVDPAAVLPARSPSGTPFPTGEPRLYRGSNIVALLVGGSDELAGQVQRAIEGLA